MPAARGHRRLPSKLSIFSTSTLDGLCDLQAHRRGREVRGVDDLGLGVQPGPGCLGVGREIPETERGRDDVLPLDPPAESVLVGVQDEVPHGNRMVSKAPC